MDSLETSSPLSKISCLTLLLIFTFVHTRTHTRVSINEYEIEKRNVNFPSIKFTLVLRKKCTLLLHYPSDLLETAFWVRCCMSPVIGIPLWYIKSCVRTLISYASKLSASPKVHHDDECSVVEPAPARTRRPLKLTSSFRNPLRKRTTRDVVLLFRIGSYRRAVKDARRFLPIYDRLKISI